MIVSVSSMGDVGIRRDSEMDTNGGDNFVGERDEEEI
jgi:hypothetical protein